MKELSKFKVNGLVILNPFHGMDVITEEEVAQKAINDANRPKRWVTMLTWLKRVSTAVSEWNEKREQRKLRRIEAAGRNQQTEVLRKMSKIFDKKEGDDENSGD